MSAGRHATAEPRGLRRESAGAYADPLHPAVRHLAMVRAKAWAKPHLPPYERRSPSGNGHGFVYLVEVRGFDLVKIGYSRDPARRMVELESGSGMFGGLRPILRIPGSPALERDLHARFAEGRLFGEWFTFTGPVAEWATSIILGKASEGGL